MIKQIITVYLYIFLQMSFIWFLYRFYKNPSIVDVSWSLGLIVSGLIYLFHPPFNLRLYFLASLLILWGMRLAGYLWFTRIRMGHVDKRYLQLSDSWKINKSLGFFLNFQLQGIFILILSFVFLSAAIPAERLFFWDKVGSVLIIVGIVGETISDLQLYYFKQANKGKLCTRGLWHYSRHPNYFFELMVWLGFAFFAFQHAYGWIGLISLLWLYIIFTKMTIPITELSSIQSKGQIYISYQERTSMLFPWFKKRANS